jgi:UDP-2,3-diacylglucosamine pyrophosphatase LpxH
VPNFIVSVTAFLLLFLIPSSAHTQGPSGPALATEGNYSAAQKEPRYLAFISDFHAGLGKQPDGRWQPTEDFRWPRALAGFLAELSRWGGDTVDLVIVGDFLELWQPPAHIKCEGRSAELGCTLDEMEEITRLVVAAHPTLFVALRDFSRRGDNRVHLIPGNHESTLLYEKVWGPVAAALGADSGRINLVRSGIWSSNDGRIVAEHGHQIGADVNRYATWPDIVQRVDGIDYVARPWGERFVQRLFNAEEVHYPIIDNLSPEAAGARYRMADRGLWGSAGDVARFLSFNLFETSLSQTLALLGPTERGRVQWSVRAGRRLGANLFMDALAPSDPFAIELRADTPEALAVRSELAAMAADADRLGDDEVRMLCDQIAIRKKTAVCIEGTLGATAQSTLYSKEQVMQRHFRERLAQFPRMRTFIYGHTHQYEKRWPVRVRDSTLVSVMNTGAFQRLVGDAGFLKRLRGRSPQEGLRTMSPEDLAPCYTAVLVEPADAGRIATPRLIAWHMDEDDGPGTVIDPADARCQ